MCTPPSFHPTSGQWRATAQSPWESYKNSVRSILSIYILNFAYAGKIDREKWRKCSTVKTTQVIDSVSLNCCHSPIPGNKGALVQTSFEVKVIALSPRVSSKCNDINTPGAEIKCSWQYIGEAEFGKLYTREGSRQIGQWNVTGRYLTVWVQYR